MLFRSITNPAISYRTYTATVTNNFGCTNTGTTIAKIYTPNSVSAVYTISTLTTGKRINLAATTVTGGIYLWTGPNGFTSTLRNPQISNATPANNGLYSVVVTSSYGCVLAAGVNVTVPTSRLVSEIAINKRFHVYPNPSASGIFNLSLSGGKEMTWEVAAADGRYMLNGNGANASNAIDLSAYPKGVYLLQVKWKGELAEVKLVR